MSDAAPTLGVDDVIAVCLKWTVHLGDGADDTRFAGISESDRAALEVGLVLAQRIGGTVTALVLGPAGADVALRDAIACGATRAVRIDGPLDAPSNVVAAELAAHLAAAQIVVCGDVSADRGSGSVPAFVAHHLGRPQALGLVGLEIDIDIDGEGDRIVATRRLDGGRRERLNVRLPCVVSVEGSVASLRRAALRAALAARTATIEVVPLGTGAIGRTHETVASVTPYRPRARALAAPAGVDVFARLRALTDASADTGHGELVTLDPPAAAARIVATLHEWGYLSP